MYKLKRREFVMDGVIFHINDNVWRNEFEGHYIVRYYEEYSGTWREIGKVDTARAAKECAREYLKYRW